MEWHIMNSGGVSGLCSNLGHVDEDGEFIPSDECEGNAKKGVQQFFFVRQSFVRNWNKY